MGNGWWQAGIGYCVRCRLKDEFVSFVLKFVSFVKAYFFSMQ
jgi:hypothetical protein